MVGQNAVGGMGDGKKSWLGHLLSSHDAYTMAYVTSVSYKGSDNNFCYPLPN